MVFETSAPFLMWIVYLLTVVRGENNQTMKIVQLFQLALKPEIDINSELTNKNYHLLRGLSAKINSLRELGQVNLFQYRTRNEYRFNIYIIVALFWSFILCGAYTYWINRYAIDDNCGGASCSIFIILIILSIFHFSVPLLILASFIFKSNIIIQDINIFHDMNMGEIRTKDVGSLLRNVCTMAMEHFTGIYNTHNNFICYLY
jgi:hypothetical protein